MSMRVALKDLARVVRSKNAGPTLLTVDVFFRDAAAYALAVDSAALQPAAVARIYGVSETQVQRYLLAHLAAIKYTLPRRICAGDPGDGDLYGAQQHAPMLEMTL
jgi:Domain of unknown function (DUF4387)